MSGNRRIKIGTITQNTSVRGKALVAAIGTLNSPEISVEGKKKGKKKK